MLLFNFAAFSQAGQKWSTSGNEVSSNEFIGTTNKVPLIFKTDNTEKLRISHNGNVGIGITVPLSKLHINGDIRSTSFAGLGNGLVLFNNDGVFTKLQFNNDANTVLLGNGTFGKYQDDDWKISGNNMYSLMSGNVGIGIENPEFKLDVNGDAKIRGELLIGNSIRLNGITDQISTTTGTLDFGTTNIITSGNINATSINFTGDSQFETLNVDGLTQTGKLVSNDYIELENTLRFTGGNAEISGSADINLNTNGNLFLNPVGNTIISNKVGIGTDNPLEMLDVRGNANIRGTLYVYEGIITGRRVNSEMIKSDTVKTDNLEVVEELITKSIEAREDMISQKMYATEKVVTELTESRLIQSEEITTRDMKFGSNLVILGNESKIYSTINHINFANTSLTTTGNILSGQMQTGTLFADNIEITNTPKFTNLELANSLKVGENSVWITSINQAGSSDNNIYSDNGDLKIQCQNNGNNTIINRGNGNVVIGKMPELNNDNKLDVFGAGKFGKANGYVRFGYNDEHAFLDGFDINDSDEKLHINWYSGANVLIGGGGSEYNLPNKGNLEALYSSSFATKSGNVLIGSNGNAANLEIKGDLKLNSKNIYLKSGDIFHGLAYSNSFATKSIDGPVLYGWGGGALGSKSPNENIALKWDYNGDVFLYKQSGAGEKMLIVNNEGKIEKREIPSLCTAISCEDGKVGIGSVTQHNKLLTLESNDPEILMIDNSIECSTCTKTEFSILNANGMARLISNKSAGIFINGDNNEDNNYFGIYNNHYAWGVTTTDPNNPSQTITTSPNPLMRIWENGRTEIWGNVNIKENNSESSPTAIQLRTDGRIWAKEVKVKSTNPYTADFVFEKDYKLPTLKEVEEHITKHKHLKDVPSAKEIEAEGTDLQKMTGILLQKIEELTLYTIEQQKRIEKLEFDIKTLK